jgi:hypothetical protein
MIDHTRQLEQQYLSAAIARAKLWQANRSATDHAESMGIQAAYLEAVAAEQECLKELRAAVGDVVRSLEETA